MSKNWKGKAIYTPKSRQRGPQLHIYWGPNADLWQLGLMFDRRFGGIDEDGTSVDNVPGVTLLLPWLRIHLILGWKRRHTYRFILSPSIPEYFPCFWNEEKQVWD